MAKDIVFVPNEIGIMSLYQGDGSPVVRHMRRKANQTSQLAKLRVGKQTGRLAESIRVWPTQYGAGGAPYVRIGSRLNYSLMHHTGTRPHIIRAKGGGMLSFNTRNGHVFATVVKHPGTRANWYLKRALEVAMSTS
jgi:hypothetical protein